MGSASLRADQDVLPQAKIVLDVRGAPPLSPSPVDRDGQSLPPPIRTSRVENDA